MEFYEHLAIDYDQMTRFEDRMASERIVLTGLLSRYPASSILDLACGTGLHVILLQQMGIRAVGVDLSAAMLDKARQNARQAGVQAQWLQSSMQCFTEKIDEKFDAVWCLGNSLPHLLTAADARKAIQSFKLSLRPHGRIIIQQLNYDRILDQKERIVGIHRNHDREFIRFYDFLPDLIQLNILIIRWLSQKNTHSFHSTLLYPYRQSELHQLLTMNGFVEVEFFGDLNFCSFDLMSSRNLIVSAKAASDQ